MTIPEQIATMETALKSAGKAVHDLCTEAGIDRATWQRWKSSQVVPNMATWGRAQEAFGRITETSE